MTSKSATSKSKPAPKPAPKTASKKPVAAAKGGRPAPSTTIPAAPRALVKQAAPAKAAAPPVKAAATKAVPAKAAPAKAAPVPAKAAAAPAKAAPAKAAPAKAAPAPAKAAPAKATEPAELAKVVEPDAPGTPPGAGAPNQHGGRGVSLGRPRGGRPRTPVTHTLAPLANATKVAALGVVRDESFMYYVKADGVWRVLRDKTGGTPTPELIAPLKVLLDLSELMYFLDADGDISGAPRTRGGKP